MEQINRENELFPEKLKSVKPEIKQIYIKGNLENLNKFGIAVIGSRNASKEGEKITRDFTKVLTKYGINIISGLAKGIDSVAHEECLNNEGKTIAVVGSGLNYIYPKENSKLYEEIVKSGGTIVSEYEPNVEPNSKNFPQRNRIISGLSDGILVVEGKYRSGTTITCEFGIKQKKPVFCIPHSIFNTYGKGPNSILKKGGIVVTEPQDIIEYFGLKKENKIHTYKNEILKLLDKEILTREELAIKTNKSIVEINQELTILELEGKIEEILGKGFRIIEQ